MPARYCRPAGWGVLAALLLSAPSAAAGAAATSLHDGVSMKTDDASDHGGAIPGQLGRRGSTIAPVCNLSAGVWSNSKTKDIGHVEFEQFADGTVYVQ